MAAERRPWRYIAAEDRPRVQLEKKKSRSGHVVGVAWQPDRVKWSQNLAIKDDKNRVFIDIDHNLKQNNQTIKILRDDRLIGGFEATTAFERGRAEEERRKGGLGMH
jgi:hypothetical protein